MNPINLFRKYVPDWKILLQKCIPYVLAVILVAATSFAVFATQNNHSQEEVSAMDEAAAKMEAQQQELETTKQELQSLLEQLGAASSDTKDLLEQVKTEGITVTDKIGQLQEAYENVENKEQQQWVLPIRYKLCTSSFGPREHPIAGEAKFHYGMDLAADRGTPIVASRSGTVIIADFEEGKGGNHVVIDHLDGYESKYMHMDKYIVTQGQFVVTGQIIGYCGQTGAATGDHLHFEIWKNNEVVNPADFMKFY